ncbi:hypothetical protein ACP70R_035718 [Stipagrostis hirtigluma subsp. patula]
MNCTMFLHNLDGCWAGGLGAYKHASQCWSPMFGRVEQVTSSMAWSYKPISSCWTVKHYAAKLHNLSKIKDNTSSSFRRTYAARSIGHVVEILDEKLYKHNSSVLKRDEAFVGHDDSSVVVACAAVQFK